MKIIFNKKKKKIVTKKNQNTVHISAIQIITIMKLKA